MLTDTNTLLINCTVRHIYTDGLIWLISITMGFAKKNKKQKTPQKPEKQNRNTNIFLYSTFQR